MIESGNISKKQRQLLNLERFNLLPDNIAEAINTERQLGNFPNPLVPIPQQEFEDFKNLMSSFLGPEAASTDEDFAKIYYSIDRAAEFVTDRDVLKEVGAITGGIVLPTMISGGTGFPAALANFVQKYPRYAKTLAAFFGGTGGSAPFSDSYLEALGY